MLASTFYPFAGKKMKEMVKPYGFKKNGRFFYRITEEGIIQQFCLLWLHNDFTVRFDLSSIYGYNSRDIEGSEIYELIDGSKRWLSWSYSPCSQAPQQAADLCVQAVQDVLLPFFESHKDPLSVRDFLVAHHPAILKDTHPYDLRELGLHWCLEDWDSAKDFLSHYIENHDRYHPRWWCEVEQEYRQLLQAICSDDHKYIAQYLEEKKAATYAEYKWKQPGR